MYVANEAGVACAWARANTDGELQSRELLQRAVAAMQATGLADVWMSAEATTAPPIEQILVGHFAFWG